MEDDQNTPQQRAETNAGPATGSATRAGFCQECGRALTFGSLRRVEDGIFCEACATFHQGGSGWQNIPAGTYQGGSGGPGLPGAGGPNPVLAGILGFIPGVGAMYNAQFAKGAMHLIVFVVLVALADNLNWVFWWLVWGWIFYQAFEAYHTARARRDQLPLPNPFGWNDLGERMGFVRPPTPAPGPSPVEAGRAYAHRPRPNWAGYVPPQPPVAPPYSPFAEHRSENPYEAAYTPPAPTSQVPPLRPPTTVPYAPTFVGPTASQPAEMPLPVLGSRRFPLGAVWLIGLGLLFLLGNLLPELRLTGQWFVPILLAALAVWSASRRLHAIQNGRVVGGHCGSLPSALTGPTILLTIAALLSLQTAHLLPMRRSWPVLLVVWGSMLLLQRGTRVPVVPAHQHVPEDLHVPDPLAPPVRSTSGTGALGL